MEKIPADGTAETAVVITAIRIPFGSLVLLLVKLALAIVPALLLLALIGAFAVMMLGGYAALLGK